MNIYIHVPFCREKCAYCAFYSVENAPDELIEQYLNKLDRDLAELPDSLEFETLFIGGGTPNLLADKFLAHLINILQKRLHFIPGAEVTMECNPASLTRNKLLIAGSLVNRLSFGVQSFKPELRRILGRVGENDEISQAINWAKELGFSQIGIDLIYNIPTQELVDFEYDLEIVNSLDVNHLSCYALTGEEGAKLSKWPTSDEVAAEMWSMIPAKSSFERYEISNYTREGSYCRHNLNIWRGGKLLGFGPAAASFDGVDRYANVPSLSGWLAGAPMEIDRIDPAARKREIFAVNLRTVAGWSEKFGQKTFGNAEFERQKTHAIKISRNFPGCFDFNSGIRLTQKGLSFWDDIAMEII